MLFYVWDITASEKRKHTPCIPYFTWLPATKFLSLWPNYLHIRLDLHGPLHLKSNYHQHPWVTGSNFCYDRIKVRIWSANLSLKLCCVALRGRMLNVITFAPTTHTTEMSGSCIDEKFPSSSMRKQALRPAYSRRAAINLSLTCRQYSTR